MDQRTRLEFWCWSPAQSRVSSPPPLLRCLQENAREHKGALRPINATNPWLHGDEAPAVIRTGTSLRRCSEECRRAGRGGQGAIRMAVI
jgi:hypothetical protein